VLLALFVGGALFAQSAESDFETAPDEVYGGVTITKYVGWDTAIKIPAAIGGKPVTAIGKEAFAQSDLLCAMRPKIFCQNIGIIYRQNNIWAVLNI
jgi:hypothetical protein